MLALKDCLLITAEEAASLEKYMLAADEGMCERDFLVGSGLLQFFRELQKFNRWMEE